MNLPAQYALFATCADGRRAWWSNHVHGVGGCVLMELVLQGACTIKNGRAYPGPPPEGAVIRRMWEDIRDRPGKRLEALISRWADGYRLRWFQELLAEEGILERRERRFLGIVPYTRFPERDSRPEAALRARIRAAVEGREAPSIRIVALASVLESTSLLQQVPTSIPHRRARSIVRGWAKDPAVAASNQAVVEAIRSAIAVTVAAATAATIAVR